MVTASAVHTTGVNWDSLSVIVGAVVAATVAILGYLTSLRKKVQDIHVTLNHRLDEWMTQTQTTIADLKTERAKRARENVGKEGQGDP